MSETTTCPDCGLTVPADRIGKPKKHVREAVRAGLKAADCVRRANERDQRQRQRRKDRNRWDREYRARKESMADVETTLPKHLR